MFLKKSRGVRRIEDNRGVFSRIKILGKTKKSSHQTTTLQRPPSLAGRPGILHRDPEKIGGHKMHEADIKIKTNADKTPSLKTPEHYPD